MIAQLLTRAFNGMSQQLGRQVGLVGLRLHEQAKTKIWARMALDMFFPSVFEVKNAPERLLRPALDSSVGRRTTSQRPATFEIPKAPPPFPSKILTALATLPTAAESAAPLTSTSKPPSLHSDVSPSDKKAAAVVHGPMSRQAFEALTPTQVRARKAALARLDGTYAETREVAGMAIALGIQIDVYKRVGNSPFLIGSTFVDPSLDNPTARIALLCENEHFEPMRQPPASDDAGFTRGFVPYDPETTRAAFGVGAADPHGNCFYHSVAQLMGLTDVQALREMACDAAEASDMPSAQIATDEDAKRHVA